MADITQNEIIFFREKCHLFCDGKCYKAWGINSRPRIKINGKEYWVADDEFDYAPDNPGTYEGGDGKPFINSGEDMNKWCARECERSKIINIKETPSKDKLLNFDKQVLIY